MRVIDLALPLLEAGKGLRFAVLPEGLDPDDLIKAQGPAAMQALIDNAMPMVRLLWQRETEGRDFDSPERRAALDKQLRQVVSRIQDPSIREHYELAIKDLRWQLFRGGQGGAQPGRQGGGMGRKPWGKRVAPVQPSTKGSALASGDNTELLREGVILAALITRPELLEQVESTFERTRMSTPDHQMLQSLILRHAHEGGDTLRARINETAPGALEKLFAPSHIRISPAIRHRDDVEMVLTCLSEELAKLDAIRGARAETDDAMHDIQAVADEGLTWRLSQAAEARNRAILSKGEDKAVFDVADNGALVDRAERRELDDLLSKLTFSKPGRRG